MFVLKLELSSSGSYQDLDQKLETEEEHARIEARVGLVSSCLSAREVISKMATRALRAEYASINKISPLGN